MLKETIENDFKSALKGRDSVRADTLRMLKSRIANGEIAKQKQLSDQDILPLLASEIKRRKESINAYAGGGRQDLADKERAEMEILQKYLPQQLSEQEIAAIIDRVLAGQNFTAADFGKAMALVMPQLKGKADGSAVSAALKQKLNS